MADANSTEQCDNNQQHPLEYRQLLWGDLIYGTKDQLQNIGLAEGLLFPGEMGGPKRTLNVTDPRGFITKIEKSIWKGADIYSASISFPGRDQSEGKLLQSFAEGVTKNEECCWYDEYIGTAVALSAAGLIRVDQLPGMPGMRKVRVTILSDGTLPLGAKTSNCPRAREPGAKWIEKASKTTYRVFVIIPKDEEELRMEKRKHEKAEWESRLSALPRPAPLIEIKHTTGCGTGYHQFDDPEKHRDYLDTTCRIVEAAFEDRKFEYTPETTCRLFQAIAELKQAIACAVVAPTPLYQRNGNVLKADFRKGHAGSLAQ